MVPRTPGSTPARRCSSHHGTLDARTSLPSPLTTWGIDDASSSLPIPLRTLLTPAGRCRFPLWYPRHRLVAAVANTGASLYPATTPLQRTRTPRCLHAVASPATNILPARTSLPISIRVPRCGSAPDNEHVTHDASTSLKMYVTPTLARRYILLPNPYNECVTHDARTPLPVPLRHTPVARTPLPIPIRVPPMRIDPRQQTRNPQPVTKSPQLSWLCCIQKSIMYEQ